MNRPSATSRSIVATDGPSAFGVATYVRDLADWLGLPEEARMRLAGLVGLVLCRTFAGRGCALGKPAAPVTVDFEIITRPLRLRIRLTPVPSRVAQDLPSPALSPGTGEARGAAPAGMTRLDRVYRDETLTLTSGLARLPMTAPPAPPGSQASTPGQPDVSAADYFIQSLTMLDDLRRSEQDVENLAAELDETHRGVLALYRDLQERTDRIAQLEATFEERVAQTVQDADRRARRLRGLASQLTIAQQFERRRFARMLHDQLQQMLVACHMRIGMTLSRVPPATSTVLTQIDELLNECLTLSRNLTVELSPPVLYQSGLQSALKWLAHDFEEKHNLNTTYTVRGSEPGLEEDLKLLLFDAVRELLVNVVEHARTSAAHVVLDYTAADTVRIVVEDAGRGFDATPLNSGGWTDEGGYGLFSIRERLAWFEGALEIKASPEHGSRATIAVPLHQASPRGDGEPETGTAAAPARARHLGPAVSEDPPAEHAAATPRIAVLLADDHKLVREGLRSVIDDQPDMMVVAEARNGNEAIALTRQLHPDVVVMDVNMPGLNGIDATRRLKTSQPSMRIIGLSMHEDAEVAEAMQDAGAIAYITKDSATERLCDTIRQTRPAHHDDLAGG